MADAKKKWDLTSTHSMGGACGWLRKRGDCILVVAIRANDVAISVDERVTPLDAMQLLKAEMPAILRHLETERVKEKQRDRQSR